MAIHALVAGISCHASPSSEAPDAPAPSSAAPPAASAEALSPAPAVPSSLYVPLSTDVAGRTEALAALSPRPRTRVVSGIFVLATSDAAFPLDRAASLVDATTSALLSGPFVHRPTRGVTVWLFTSQADFDRAVRMRAPALPAGEPGLYVPSTREVFVTTATVPLDTLGHETTHVLLESDFPRAPAWLREGVASLFESPDFSVPGEIHGKAHFRLQTLRDALASPERRALVRLDALFAMSDDAFRRGPLVYLHYAMAREAMRWLDGDKRALWAFYAAWRDGVLADATGERAFAAVLGKTAAEAQDEWVQWIGSDRAER